MVNWGLLAVVHLVLLMVTAAGVATTTDTCQTQVPDWACGTPFDPIFDAYGSDVSFGSLLGGSLSVGTALVSLLTFNYAILAQPDTVMGSIGFIIRTLGITFTGVVIVMGLLSIVRR